MTPIFTSSLRRHGFGLVRVGLNLAVIISAGTAFAQTLAPPDWQARIRHAEELLQQGLGAEAVGVLDRAARDAEVTLGAADAATGELWFQLAATHHRLGHDDQAAPILLRLLATREKAFGPNHPSVAEAANVLAVVYYSQGRTADAAPLLERALAIWEKAGPALEPRVATVLGNLAEMYRATGRAAQAEPLQRRVLAIKEKTLGSENREVPEAMARLGVICVDLGRYEEAARLFERAMDIDVRVLGPTHQDVGILLGNLAVMDRVLGRFGQSEGRSRRALEILQAVPGPPHPELIKQVRNLGDLALARGRYAEAVSFQQQAIAAMTKVLGPDHPELALPMNSLAGALAQQGKYATAEAGYRQSLALLEKAKGPSHPDVAQGLGNLGLLFTNTGRYAEAGVVLGRALRLKQDGQGPDHPDVALTLVNLASLRALQGRYPEAEAMYRRALSIQEKGLGMEQPAVAITLNNLATLMLDHGRPGEAEPLLVRGLAIQEKAFGGEHEELSTTLNNLYLCRRAQGRATEAESLLRRSLTLAERTLGPEHPKVAKGLSNLGLILLSAGRAKEGEPLQARALSIWEKALGPDHPEVALALNNLALFSESLGRLDQAETMFRRALERSEALGAEHPQVALVSGNMGALYYAWGRPKEAVALSSRGIAITRAQLHRSFAYMSEKERLAFLDSVTSPFSLYLSLCLTYHAQMPELSGRMYDFALWNKGFVVGGLAALRARVEASGDREAQSLLGRLTATRTQIATLVSSPPPDLVEWRTTVERLSSDANAIEKELARRSETFSEQARLEQATWRDVRQALRPGEAAVEFIRFPFHDGKRFTGRTRYVALILTPLTTTTPTLVDMGDAEALETEAFSTYSTRVRSRAFGLHEGSGRRFHAALWQPLESALLGSKRVYLAPEGKLNQVSWGAVQDGAGALLIERLDLRLLSSTRDLVLARRVTAGTSAVLMGNPDFDLDSTPPGAEGASAPMPGAGFRSRDAQERAMPLPSTGPEVLSIQSSLKARGWTSVAYTGARALEGTIKQLRSPRVLHVATHGFFMPDQERSLTSAGISDGRSGAEDPMLRAGLLFAGANRALLGGATPLGAEDGVLTAYEASGLNLQGTELVVLSACETGLGEIRNGEGVFGLRRALEVAGAQNVLMSLWSVPDRETQELMGLFYDAWLLGKDKHDALRAAQLEMRQRVLTRYGQDLPYYWAAFIMVGR